MANKNLGHIYETITKHIEGCAECGFIEYGTFINKLGMFSEYEITVLKRNSKAMGLNVDLCGALFEMLEIVYGRETVGMITFKAEGNCFKNQIKSCKADSTNVSKSLSLPVITVGPRVIDFHNKYFNMNIIDYVKMLYGWNDTIRIDYTLSRFMSDDSKIYGISLDMCRYLQTHDGLPKEKFDELVKSYK